MVALACPQEGDILVVVVVGDRGRRGVDERAKFDQQNAFKGRATLNFPLLWLFG